MNIVRIKRIGILRHGGAQLERIAGAKPCLEEELEVPDYTEDDGRGKAHLGQRGAMLRLA